MSNPNLPEPEEIARYLSSTELFKDLDEDTLRSLEKELEWVTVLAGSVVMRQGEVGDSLFILLSGRLRAFVASEQGAEEVVGEITPGETVGDMAIIADEPRSATVRAIRHSLLVRLTREGFERLESRHPQVMKRIARLLVRRLRDQNVSSERRVRPLTIGITAVDPDLPLSDFSRFLANALSRIDTTVHLNEAMSKERSESQITSWLSEQEHRHRFVVYEAAGPDSAWTARVISQSDRILIVVGGDKPPAGDAATAIAAAGVSQSNARKDLVLAHSGRNRTASGTLLWIKAVGADEHHHLWMYSAHDFDRLARIVAGKANGLVLGGGGARGFAHIGVIRALLEAGVPIDYVGGTSIGALIAAQCALDWNASKMLEADRVAFRESPLRGDYTLPVVSVVTPRGGKVKLYESLFNESRIEDQWRNYFCIACNLTRGEMVVHRQGLFRDCVQASSALPVLDPPVFDNGDVIVDGAVINNLPADVMKRLCGGRVIAVDVSPRRDLRSLTSADSVGGGAGSGASRIIRAGQRASVNTPGIFSIVMRTIMLSSVISADTVKRHTDVYLKPPIDHIEMFDWMAIDEAAEIGYRYTVEQLNGTSM